MNLAITVILMRSICRRAALLLKLLSPDPKRY